MVSFRFYLITITSIFLALALGIAVGAAVVDRATVDALKNRVEDVDRKAEEKDQVNQRLAEDLNRWSEFSAAAEASLVDNRLAGSSIMTVAVRPIDDAIVDALNDSLSEADARLAGTVWLEPEWDDTSESSIAKLDEAVAQVGEIDAALVATQRASTSPAVVTAAQGAKELAYQTLSNCLASSLPLEDVLAPFVRAGFVSIDDPDEVVGAIATDEQRPDDLLVVFAADRGAELVLDDLPLSVVGSLDALGTRVVAVEDVASMSQEVAEPDMRKVAWVQLVREDSVLAQRVSTVDGVQDLRGRIATVVALAALPQNSVGHFGFGDGASAPYPEAE